MGLGKIIFAIDIRLALREKKHFVRRTNMSALRHPKQAADIVGHHGKILPVVVVEKTVSPPTKRATKYKQEGLVRMKPEIHSSVEISSFFRPVVVLV